MLREFLKQLGKEAEVIKFPQRSTDFGTSIDQFLKKEKKYDDKMIHLLFTINRWEMKETIMNRLHNNQHVILDRYSYSGIAYSHAKGVDLNWCMVTEQGLPKPDLVIYLRVDQVENISQRKGFGDEIYEKEQFQKQVKGIYENCLVENEWKVVDAC